MHPVLVMLHLSTGDHLLRQANFPDTGQMVIVMFGDKIDVTHKSHRSIQSGMVYAAKEILAAQCINARNQLFRVPRERPLDSDPATRGTVRRDGDSDNLDRTKFPVSDWGSQNEPNPTRSPV